MKTLIRKTEIKLKILKIIKDNETHFRKKHRMREYRKEFKYFTCKVSQEEFNKITQHANKTGLKPTSFFKKSAFAYLEQKFLVPQDLKIDLETLIFLIRNISNNLNQIAKHANQAQQLSFSHFFKAHQTVSELEDLIKDFVKNPPLKHDD